jgi:hypothetical protein
MQVSMVEAPRIGELRRVPVGLVVAFEDRARRRAAVQAVIASVGASLGRAWHGLGYVLRGSWDGGRRRGVSLEGGDAGFGPAELITPLDVEVGALALAAIDERSLRAAYDAAGMEREGVYPGGWDAGTSCVGWLLAAFRRLRAFYVDAAERGDGVLYFVS